ncbi:C6 zinc finger domain protein [Penicillium taxi]|uniref:C6 zinc finger domain protein n=1 Tax=Penicillium taxi TaxID=168475 RepID=UPI002545528C|nr:C6 zinc finger domain protein [Penicillium taxi]KAJ5895008.1 C6 zinc finger domain protein [Penicillium taxi]
MTPTPSTGQKSGKPERTRSRRGCKTCKIRKVKCGEEKPHCLRCTSTGRKCEYEESALSILENPLALLPNTVWRERRAFAYYFHQAAPFIGGGLDIGFWSTIVPQICRSEPAVWDAIISIGALFESPEPYPNPASIRGVTFQALNQNHRDALSWYSRSVSSMRRRIEDGRIDTFVGLITCILFICIEAIQGATEEAFYLYMQGVQLALTLRAQISCGALPAQASLLEETIIPIFVRLGTIAPPISGIPTNTFQTDAGNPSVESLFISPKSPQEALKSAREAIVILSTEIQVVQRACDEYLQKAGSFNLSTYRVPRELEDQQTILSARLRRWYIEFTHLMESLNDRQKVLPPQQTGTCALLLNYYDMLLIIITTCSSPSLSITDTYETTFQSIIDRSSVVLNASLRLDGTQPPFTFELSVGLPLWFVCLRCREPSIRRQAIALLRQSTPVQGLSTSVSAATFGERMMMLEEKFGMTMNMDQGVVNATAPICDAPDSPQRSPSRSPGQSSSCSGYDLSVFADPESEHVPTICPIPENPNRVPSTVFIPEEARIGPICMFRPRDGLPIGTNEEDIARYNGRHEVFLRFTMNRRLAADTWQIVHEYVPTVVP